MKDCTHEQGSAVGVCKHCSALMPISETIKLERKRLPSTNMTVPEGQSIPATTYFENEVDRYINPEREES